MMEAMNIPIQGSKRCFQRWKCVEDAAMRNYTVIVIKGWTMGNILTDIRMEACCRKIHILNAASNQRHNIPVHKWYFLISIPQQFSERMKIEKGMKLFFMMDKETSKAIAFTKRFQERIDAYTTKYFDGAKLEMVERKLTNKTISPKQFSFYITYDCMKLLGWPCRMGTYVRLKIVDDLFLKISLVS